MSVTHEEHSADNLVQEALLHQMAAAQSGKLVGLVSFTISNEGDVGSFIVAPDAFFPQLIGMMEMVKTTMLMTQASKGMQIPEGLKQ